MYALVSIKDNNTQYLKQNYEKNIPDTKQMKVEKQY